MQNTAQNNYHPHPQESEPSPKRLDTWLYIHVDKHTYNERRKIWYGLW
jgi:hypothetical protein